MHGRADAAGLAAGGEPWADLAPPVDYDHPWGWVAVALVAAVLAWHVVVWWVTRDRRAAGAAGRRAGRPGSSAASRRRALAELAAIEADVTAGRTDQRAAHQRMSEVLRGFVAEVSGVPARSMALADLRAAGLHDVAAVIAQMYPPEFAPDPGPDPGPAPGRATADRFTTTLTATRELVSSWR